MRAAPLRAALVLVASLILTACGEGAAQMGGPAGPRAQPYRAHGLTVELPAGWRPAARTLTPRLLDPREVLAVATFPLRYRPTDCAHVPGSALEDLGPGDALITVQERGVELGGPPPVFPPRPASFGPDLGGPSEASTCVHGTRFSDHRFAFAEGDRRFEVDVAFGSAATQATRLQAWGILDSLRVDRRVRPDWPASN